MIPVPTGARGWPATGHIAMREGFDGPAAPMQDFSPAIRSRDRRSRSADGMDGQGAFRSASRAYLARPIAMMHADGAQAVADYFECMLAQRPDIDWTPGG